MFGRLLRKWHTVKWHSGDRRVNLSIQFATGPSHNGNGELPPQIERLLGPVRSKAPLAMPPPEEQIIAEVLQAVAEFNERNRTHVRVSAIRYRDDDTTGHCEAAHKLLNRM